MFTPLRITTDSVEYLSVAASLADGQGCLFDGKPTQHPCGYAFMISILDRTGIARSWSLVGLNDFLLLLGLMATYFVARRSLLLSRNSSLLASILTALSFLIVKHSPTVLSDIPFLGLSLTCLAVLVWVDASDRSSWKVGTGLVSALILAIAAVLTRAIGVTLFPVFALVLIRKLRFDFHIRKKKKLWVVLALIGCVVGIISTQLFFRTMYGRMFLGEYASQGGLLWTVFKTVLLRVRELGVVTLNTPPTKVPLINRISWLIGAMSMTLLGLNLYRRRRELAAADIYLFSCFGGLLLTPWAQDARYWIPILPVLVIISVAEISSLSQTSRAVEFAGYLLCFVYIAMGLIATGYSTRITFSNSKFPDLYGGADSSFARPYRMVLFHEPESANGIDPDVIRVLRRYAEPKHLRSRE
jgi:hypothetical protein